MGASRSRGPGEQPDAVIDTGLHLQPARRDLRIEASAFDLDEVRAELGLGLVGAPVQTAPSVAVAVQTGRAKAGAHSRNCRSPNASDGSSVSEYGLPTAAVVTGQEYTHGRGTCTMSLAPPRVPAASTATTR